ncbi:hypothetical protein DICVIV_04208 [Dictyocaulus viviparus]|uniref:Uncharacterized protein n=1 Tax=Dictyocaulus viviparus TaxID=29172 RepID=A0A0D8Y0I9_DICVI|nr:hypothetical protein DICVIV_04208 [Dictyocaulus viviparus]
MSLTPLMGFLHPDNVNRMTDLAVELSSLAARSITKNEKDVARTVDEPREIPLGTRPSEILGQATTSSLEIRHSPIIQSETPLGNPVGAVQSGPLNSIKSVDESVNLPSPAISKPFTSLEDNPLLKLASSFLGGTTKESSQRGQRGELLDFGGIKDYVPGANNNFGLRKGPGCLPFVSEFMQVAYGNCQKVADEKAFDAWGDELKSAILTGQIDLLKASQETCRRGAERQQCGALRQAISNCDIIESLQIGAQLQRAMKRCEDVSGLLDQIFVYRTMLLISTLLVFSTVTAYPNTVESVSTQVAADPSKPILFASNSTNPANSTENSYVGLRASLENDVNYLRSGYQKLRHDFDEWMEAPYHRNVVVPAIVGVMAAGVALILYCLVRTVSQRCAKKFTRTRISYMSRDYNGEKKRMVPKRNESEEDE